MLPRHRRYQSTIGGMQRRKSRVISRLMIGVFALFIAWYLVTKVLALFDYSVGMHKGAILTVRAGGDTVQVSLQGGEWQHAESGLKLDAGDAVSTHAGGDVLLQFFDGSRVRLGEKSDVLIETNNRFEGGESAIDIEVRAGKVWLATPDATIFSGSILRNISTRNFVAHVPPNTQALISQNMLAVVRASGIGLETTIQERKNTTYVGEGQYLNLAEDTLQSIATGQDPYDFRDPITPQLLKDDFLSSSYALLSQNIVTAATSSASSAKNTNEDLTIIAPENQSHVTGKTVTIKGKTSARIAAVLVNGQVVPINKDQTFSVEMSVSKEPTINFHIEAHDAQGITLTSTDRTVINDYKPFVEPLRFKSPVGSGETLTTGLKEIEITGEAPANTAAVIINDYKLQLFKSGNRTWSYLASEALGNLLPGKNIFTVFALDAGGNRSPGRSITIDYLPTATSTNTGAEVPLKQNAPLSPGSLSVIAPEAGTTHTTEQKEVVIEGSTSVDTHSISINGYTLSLYLSGKTTWNYIASIDYKTMKRGRNVYRIVSRNKNGEILDLLEYTVTYQP